MDLQLWAAIETLYRSALEKSAGDRAAYLAAACTEDPTLRSEVESLLCWADAKLSGPVQRPDLVKVWDDVAGTSATESGNPGAADGSDSTPSTTFGQYRVLRLVGEGGMGAVYEAEQDQPRRPVALKVIRPGLTGGEILRRFEQESRALAR